MDGMGSLALKRLKAGPREKAGLELTRLEVAYEPGNAGGLAAG
jgi:hypothetical protein